MDVPHSTRKASRLTRVLICRHYSGVYVCSGAEGLPREMAKVVHDQCLHRDASTRVRDRQNLFFPGGIGSNWTAAEKVIFHRVTGMVDCKNGDFAADLAVSTHELQKKEYCAAVAASLEYTK